MANILDRLLAENYTTEQVANALGRTPEHWCRIRHHYIAKYKLKMVKIGRRHYYNKKTVDAMVEELLKNGEEKITAKSTEQVA